MVARWRAPLGLPARLPDVPFGNGLLDLPGALASLRAAATVVDLAAGARFVAEAPPKPIVGLAKGSLRMTEKKQAKDETKPIVVETGALKAMTFYAHNYETL